MPVRDSETPYILLVDDNDQGLLARRSLLEELGYHVAIANCAEKAIECCGATRFDVVVTDYRMPGMNGLELIARLRRLQPVPRIVLLSGYADCLGFTEENTGADSVISKSHREVAHLTHAIGRLASRRAVRKPAMRQQSCRSALAKTV